jgi:predicted RNase H-like HicB family nuclease
MLKYIIEKANGNYSAYCPDLPGCVATGKTVEETIQNMREAIKLHLEGLKADNQPIPVNKSMVCQVEVNL